MTCPHLDFSIISKKSGGSVIASAAYDQREKMFDVLENNIKHPHTKAEDHIKTMMLLPEGAQKKYLSTEKIWNDLNQIETDRVGYKLIVPFQKELSFEQNMEVVVKLFNEEFVNKGHPVQLSVHQGKNGNDHVHAIVADRRILENGKWESTKSETQYYKRGTVKELDEKGKVVNPDAVILSQEDKIDTPKLKKKKLQYDKDGNIIMEKGWQQLQYDKDGKPLLDEKGYPVMIDIREPDYITGTQIQKFSKNGKYLKPQWKKITVPKSNIRDIGNVDRIRRTWERLQNEAFVKYNIRDDNGNILKVDLRSYKERNKTLPADQQLIPTKHVGYGNKQESLLKYNDYAKAHNDLLKTEQLLKTEKEKLATIEYKLNTLPATTKRQEKSPTAATVSVAKTAVGIATGMTSSSTANKHTKIHFGKDTGKMTETERLYREYYSDEADTMDDLPDRKPKTKAIKELTNALALFKTKHQEQEKAEDVPRNNERLEQEIDAAKQKYLLTKAERETIENRLRVDYTEYRIKEYREAEKVKNQLKDTWDKECLAAQEKVNELNENRGFWMKHVQKKRYTISDSKKKELHQLFLNWKDAEKSLKSQFIEITKYPDIKDPAEKIRFYYQDRQMNLLIKDLKGQTGYQDNDGLASQYQAAQSEERAAYSIYKPFNKNPDAPSSGNKLPGTEKTKEKETVKRKRTVRISDRKTSQKPYTRK